MAGRDGMGRKLLREPHPLKEVGLKKPGALRIEEEMTVGELEKEFLESFGMLVQVSRRSGTIWLETTMTDNWTLSRQNEHGRELSH
jgi:hypothetical protein